MITKDPFGSLRSWNDSFHFCNWSGVSCGKRHRRVTALHLESQGLEGSLSPHVGNLSFLRELSIWNNSFQGTLPHDLGRLSRLRFLGLDQNKFEGFIPTNLSGCSYLAELWLGDNKLVGSIPNEISFLSKLTLLEVNNNNLTGGIPSFLGNLTSMEMFSAQENPLGGNIPETLGHWKSLKELYLRGCKLYGRIPDSLYNLSLLTTFSLPDNQLSGSLPPAIGAMLPHIAILQLSFNQLNGLIPSSMSNCSKLSYLELHNNRFDGKLAIDFAKLSDINHISIGNNLYQQGEATDLVKIIDSLKNCSKLKKLELFNSKFQAELPKSIGNLSDQLNLLNLVGNELHGSLPSSIGNLVGLSTILLGDNLLTGEIPSTIGKLQNLQLIGLYENKFSGPIPDAIGNLSLLITLSLLSNRLEGKIPSTLGNCRNLLELYLNDNKLSGQLPIKLLQLSSLSETINLSQNNLSGSIPIEVGDLKMLNNLFLSDNHLSGNIPSSLGSCTSLVSLSLKGNLFQGMIPHALSSLKGLQELDLSNNNLSGQIPRFLEKFLLEYLNLSVNGFEGEVPILGVFANTSTFSVLGNTRLCGGVAELGLPKCKETHNHKKRFPLFIIVILIAATLFAILCFVYAWLKKKRNGQPSHSSRNEKFLNVSYNQLLKATDGFSEANLIGNGGFGSVFKGTLDNENAFIAVKVLHLQNQGAQRSFIRECEAWRNIRHRNLLKIITACSSVDHQGNDFKAVVYEFMPNGSLHDWLHSTANTLRLNLLQRINILIHVASALDYLHNQCVAAIVHGDLKPSNILLDDDMVAHVGDFGLARVLGRDSNQNSSNGIRGTIGYTPPEYGIGSHMTSNGDVYSFGIIILEVMTGKRPTNNKFIEGLSLHKFASMALPDHVADVIDGDLLNVNQEEATTMQSRGSNAKKIHECVASTIKIGVSCSVDSPSQRMNIENVVHELQHILDTLQKI